LPVLVSQAMKNSLVPDHDVVVAGSGFAGLCMGVKLREAGIDNFLILEKDKEFGGTWWANHYPGCAVDVPSHMYSFSFARNPGWTRRFARQEELLAYTRSIVRDFGLGRHIRVDTALLGARFNEEHGFWVIDTSRGQMTARVLVNCLGALSLPAIPDLPGLDTFEGARFHSSRWDHGFDLRGKRVAVIGTGASAVQFIPEIAPLVARLDLYQRTAQWIMPRPDRAFGRAERWLLRRLPALQLLYRALDYAYLESRAIPFAYLPKLLRAGESMARRHMRRQVADPALRARLTPDYALGCKRVLMMNTFYPALTRANVRVLADPIARVTPRGIVDAAGEEREVDAIIFATGFAPGDIMASIEIVGRGGLRLQDTPHHGREAYKGCAVAGFPNMFGIAGPNTGLGHNSMIYMIESGVAYVIDALATMREQGLRTVEVKEEAQKSYNARLQRRLKGTVWATGCKSWYLDENGRNFTLWPGFTFAYRWITRRFDASNYEITR
jgi:cation diffusion facilitator CzcD-associated flavoprotein CzcO